MKNLVEMEYNYIPCINLLFLIYVLQPHITIFMYLFVDCTMTSSISTLVDLWNTK
jgi:hypothetical protein